MSEARIIELLEEILRRLKAEYPQPSVSPSESPSESPSVSPSPSA